MGRKDSKAKKQEELRDRNKQKALEKQEKLDLERKTESDKREAGRQRKEQREEQQRVKREEEQRLARENEEKRLQELDTSLKEVEDMDRDSVYYYLSNLLSRFDYSCEVEEEKRDSLYQSCPIFSDSIQKQDIKDVITMDLTLTSYGDTIPNELCEIQLRNRICLEQMFEQLAVHNTVILLVDNHMNCTKTIYYNNLRNGYKLMATDYCVIHPEAQVKSLYECYYKLVHHIAKGTLKEIKTTQSEQDILDLTVATHKLYYLLHLLEACNIPTNPIYDIYQLRTSHLPSVISVDWLKDFRQARNSTMLNDFEVKAIQLEILDQAKNLLNNTIYTNRLKNITLEVSLSSYKKEDWDNISAKNVLAQSLITTTVDPLTFDQCKRLEVILEEKGIKRTDQRSKKTRRGVLCVDTELEVDSSFSTYSYLPFDASFFFNMAATTLLLVVDDNLEIVDKFLWDADAFDKKELRYTMIQKSHLQEHLHNMAIFLDAGFHHRQYELMYQMYHGKSLQGRKQDRIAYDMTLYHNALEFITLIFVHYQWMRGSDGNNYNHDQKYNMPHPLTIPLCTLEFRYQVLEHFIISRLHNFDENQPKNIDISQFDSPFSTGMRLDLMKKAMEFKMNYHSLLLQTCHAPSTDVLMTVNEGIEVKKLDWTFSLENEPKTQEKNRYFYIT